MHHNFPLSLAIVHSNPAIVQELQHTLEQVSNPILEVMQHWEDSHAFRKSLAGPPSPTPLIVILDAEDASVETLLAELPNDHLVIVLCARAESVRNQESLLRLLARYGTEVIVAPFDYDVIKLMLERCRNVFTSRVFSRMSEGMLIDKVNDVNAVENSLATSIEKVMTITHSLQKDINATLNNFEAADVTHIQLPTAQGDVIFLVESIVSFEGKRDMTMCSVFEASSGTVQKTTIFLMLSALEEKLPRRDFLRVHKSFLVNVRYALRFEHKGKDGILTMKHGEPPVTVTRAYKKALLEQLKGATRPANLTRPTDITRPTKKKK